MHNFTLPENAKQLGALKPATDAAGAPAATSTGLGAQGVSHLPHRPGQRRDDRVRPAPGDQSAAGAGAKVLTGVRRIWTNLDLATNDTYARQTDALSFTTDAASRRSS
jgi:hypothetical protein